MSTDHLNAFPLPSDYGLPAADTVPGPPEDWRVAVTGSRPPAGPDGYWPAATRERAAVGEPGWAGTHRGRRPDAQPAG